MKFRLIEEKENKKTLDLDEALGLKEYTTIGDPNKYSIIVFGEWGEEWVDEAETEEEAKRKVARLNAKNTNEYNHYTYRKGEVREQHATESLKEDTIKQNGKWVNKGKEGTHGTFKTKKAADAQRKAMFARGFKESYDISESIGFWDWYDQVSSGNQQFLDSIQDEDVDDLLEDGGEDEDYVYEENLPKLKEIIDKFSYVIYDPREQAMLRNVANGQMYFTNDLPIIVTKRDADHFEKEYGMKAIKLHVDLNDLRTVNLKFESLKESLYGKDEIAEVFDKAKRLGVTTIKELKDLLAQEESKGNTEKEKIDAYADAVELGNDTLSNECLKEDYKGSIDNYLFNYHNRVWTITDTKTKKFITVDEREYGDLDPKKAIEIAVKKGNISESLDESDNFFGGMYNGFFYTLGKDNQYEIYKDEVLKKKIPYDSISNIKDLYKYIDDNYSQLSEKIDECDSLKEALNNIKEVKRKLDLFPKQITVNKELKDDLIDLLHSKNISYMIDDHMTADGKIGNRLTFVLKYPKNESLEENLNKESLEQEIRKAIREHFKTWDDEDYEDMIGEYLVVEVEDQEDGRTKVEVRAELTYNTMDKIADELNKIVQKYDKDAYFDHEDAGIINAFIDKNAEGKVIDEYDASKDEKLQGVRLRDYRNKWSAIDHMEVNGVDYYMFENDTYGDETYYIVTPNINEGPFYETFDDIETCLRDEGVLEESLTEGINKNSLKKEVKEWARDDYENGAVLDIDDTDEFEKLLLDNHPDLKDHKDMPDLIYELKDLYFDTVDNCRDNEYNLDEKLIQGKSDATLKKNIATEVKAGKDPKQAYAIAKSIQKKNENLDEEIVDYFDNSVHDEDIVEDDFDEEHIEELTKKAIEESKKHTKEVGTTITENKSIDTPTQEIINESVNSEEDVVTDYVSPNAVDPNMKPVEVDLNNI